MIILIPIGGQGLRFKNNDKPKALVEVLKKPILYYLLDNLNLKNIEYIYIPYNKEYKKYDFEKLLRNNYPDINFVFYMLENETRGAAETINISLNNLNEERDIPIICLDCDNFYLYDILTEWKGENCVFTIEDINTKPIYSYVNQDENKNVVDIIEKEKISDFACTGAYGFNSIKDLKNYSHIIINKNKTQKGEFYTSGVIGEMIKKGFKFKNKEIKNKYFFSLGTPEQVKEYEHPYIFDLDGTLVNTDHIYILVWRDIMKEYNLSVDTNFFNSFIQGKNDIIFLKTIFPNITDDVIDKISSIKDDLFINYLENYNNIMIDNAETFIKNNKNRRMGIVTSCNRKAVEFIIKKTNLDNYMGFLIASEDCNRHKPDKEPYKKAIDILKCDVDNCTVFEDSISGYKSAKSLGVNNICLITQGVLNDGIEELNEYKIENYKYFDFKYFRKKEKCNIKSLILKKLINIPIKDIIIEEKDIKTGYICDIKSLSLILNEGVEKIILKIENEENELSNVARKINLYTNEVYFYENLSKIINISIPNFYCSFISENKNYIILEDLNKYIGEFNIDLNNDIDVLLSVVKSISELHNRFYFINENEIIPVIKKVYKINEIKYYKELIKIRFNKFLKINDLFLTEKDKNILNKIFDNYELLINKAGSFPLNLCHGDLKSPNIFYKEKLKEPVFLDWQYIHLNKGISDIVFLLVESTQYNENINDIIINYYYKKTNQYQKIEDLLLDFKISLCIFPFFVMVWFNSENKETLLDKVFPIIFMKNTLKFYRKYLDDFFFDNLTV